MIHDFTYFRPGTVKEALSLIAEHKDDCKVICGGQSLLIVMRQGLVATDYLIDIKRLEELNYIKFDPTEGLRVGATTTHRAIEKSPLVKEKYGVLVSMENRLASIQVRNWGTIGGNLAHGDAAGDPAPVLMTLNASVKVGSAQKERVIPIDEFYVDLFETALEQDEIVLEVQIPVPAPKTATCYSKFNLLSSDQGIISVGASVTLDGNNACKEVRIALGNAAATVMRAKKAEEILIGKTLSDALLDEAGQAAHDECEPVADIHASEEYRRHLVKVFTKRMVKQAWEQASKA
jgi:carbon-monoxide dehydrogenase medium subunit